MTYQNITIWLSHEDHEFIDRITRREQKLRLSFNRGEIARNAVIFFLMHYDPKNMSMMVYDQDPETQLFPKTFSMGRKVVSYIDHLIIERVFLNRLNGLKIMLSWYLKQLRTIEDQIMNQGPLQKREISRPDIITNQDMRLALVEVERERKRREWKKQTAEVRN